MTMDHPAVTAMLEAAAAKAEASADPDELVRARIIREGLARAGQCDVCASRDHTIQLFRPGSDHAEILGFGKVPNYCVQVLAIRNHRANYEALAVRS